MKNGIEYFPLDCQLDDKINLIEAQFGLKGFAVVVHLLQKIYGGEGYYCEVNDDIILLFAQKYNVNGSFVTDIINASIRRGIFSEELYKKYHILTSRGVQNRYFEAVSRRKNVQVKREYLLINDTINFKNVDILSENAYINQENVYISEQSKGKESRVKESKGESFAPPTLEEVKAYCLERNNKVNAEQFIDYYTANGWVVGKSKMKDWKACIRTWERNGIDNKPSKFNFTQRTDVDYKKIERDALKRKIEMYGGNE